MEKRQITLKQARTRALIMALLFGCVILSVGLIFFRSNFKLIIDLSLFTLIFIFAISFILWSQNCSDLKRNPISYDPNWEKNLKEKLAEKFKQNSNLENDNFDECCERLNDDLHEQHFLYHYYWDIY